MSKGPPMGSRLKNSGSHASVLDNMVKQSSWENVDEVEIWAVCLLKNTSRKHRKLLAQWGASPPPDSPNLTSLSPPPRHPPTFILFSTTKSSRALRSLSSRTSLSVIKTLMLIEAEARIVVADENKEAKERARMKNHWSAAKMRKSAVIATMRLVYWEVPGFVR
ncbi:uncharacterized protein G2W53_006562 [Senna tora]|uniref:Uncharacterized protein n=1 Tax=Senna tora TaxID=362788 RepID=A0A835CEV8_9FABA|nr:uncharacterized protein G2W53_006562 [Senna tora]